MDIVKKLEEIIKEHMSGNRTDYTDGIIDGLILAIKTIEEK